MQRTWWQVVSTTNVTASYWTLRNNWNHNVSIFFNKERSSEYVMISRLMRAYALGATGDTSINSCADSRRMRAYMRAWGIDPVLLAVSEQLASLAFVGGIHRWSVNSPHKGQWRWLFRLACEGSSPVRAWWHAELWCYLWFVPGQMVE